MEKHVKQELLGSAASAALKGAPPVAVTTGALTGAFTLTDGVAIATLVYIVVQTAYLLWKWKREADKK